MSATLAHSIKAAEQAHDSVSRLARLSAMTSAELSALLGGDAATALPWVRAAAAHGIVEAQTRLGRMLLEGAGGAVDAGAALRWFTRAALDGSADAANMVGRCHENGWGTVASDVAAVRWYRRAAEAGDDWGQYNFGHMLFDGRGIALDRTAAFGWYRRAAAKGLGRAMNLVGRCLEAGWGAPVDLYEAARWYEKSARTGYFRGQYNHALTLVARGDAQEAAIWFTHAFNGGDSAMRALIEASGFAPDSDCPHIPGQDGPHRL